MTTEQNPLKDLIPPPSMHEVHKSARAKFLTSLWVRNIAPTHAAREKAAKNFQRANSTNTTRVKPHFAKQDSGMKTSIFLLMLSILGVATMWTISTITTAWMNSGNQISEGAVQATSYTLIGFVLIFLTYTFYAAFALAVLNVHNCLVHRAAERRLQMTTYADYLPNEQRATSAKPPAQ